MKKETVSQIISQIDEKYIDEATMFASDSNSRTDHKTVSQSSVPLKGLKSRPRRFSLHSRDTTLGYHY